MLNLFLTLCFFQSSFAKEGHHHMSFKNASKWVKAFEDPSRDEWQRPQELIAALQLSPNAIVGDLGAGTGYFSVRIAKMLPQSTVYGIDNEKDMVDHLHARAQKEKLNNLKAILSKDDGFSVDQKMDVLLIVDTYHHLPNRSVYFQNLTNLLKPNGQIVIVDFLPDSPTGPPQKFRFQPPQIQKELQASGFIQEKVLTWPRQFVMFLKRSPPPSS